MLYNRSNSLLRYYIDVLNAMDTDVGAGHFLFYPFLQSESGGAVDIVRNRCYTDYVRKG